MRQKSPTTILVPEEVIENKILLVRGKKVMLDRNLALLYEVETRALNQAVRRNIERFPEDFMFQLTKEEMKNWTSQFVMSNKEKMGLKRRPYAFTEPGVAMLSSVLNSNRAIQVNIQIIRTFIKLRQLLLTHVELKRKIEAMERKYDQRFRVVFEAIKQLLAPSEKSRRIIGSIHNQNRENIPIFNSFSRNKLKYNLTSEKRLLKCKYGYKKVYKKRDL